MPKFSPQQLLPIYESHLAWWSSKMECQSRNDALYRNALPGTPVPMTSQMVGAMVGALFLQDPGVIGVPGLRGEGDYELAAGVANEVLKRNLEALQTCATNAMIFDGASFVAIRPRMARDVMDRAVFLPVPAWRVIVDYESPTWETSRWVGLITELPLEVAEETYGRVGQWAAHDRKAMIDAPQVKSCFYVTIVEFWIPSEGRMVTWSPDCTPDKWVYEGEEVQVGGRAEDQEEQEDAETENIDGMLYSSTGSPLIPIIPVNFNPSPLTPNFGTSFVTENSPQLLSLNAVSTAQVNMASKARRLYRLSSAEVLDDTNRQVLEGHEDSAVVILRGTGDVPIRDVLDAVPLLPVPADVPALKADLQADLERATSLPAFSMGQATKATATEVNQLTAYADSKLGAMASVLARAVAQAAEVSVAMVRVMLGDAQETILLPKPVGPRMIQASDLEGDWRFLSQDGAGTPAAMMKRAGDLERLSPLLIQLGVPPQTVLKELVQAYSLPESFLEQPKTLPAGAPNEA